MAQITILPGIVQQFDVATQADVDALKAQVASLQETVASLTRAVLLTPLDGEDMTYWLTKLNQIEGRQFQNDMADFPGYFDATVSLSPSGQATMNGMLLNRAEGNGTIYLTDSPRLANPIQTEAIGTSTKFTLSFQAEENTTYYVSFNGDDGSFYQRAVFYNATTGGLLERKKK